MKKYNLVMDYEPSVVVQGLLFDYVQIELKNNYKRFLIDIQ